MTNSNAMIEGRQADSARRRQRVIKAITSASSAGSFILPTCTPGPHCSGSTPSSTRIVLCFLTKLASRSPLSRRRRALPKISSCGGNRTT